MVFFVESELAAPIRVVGGGSSGLGGSAPEVHDLDGRGEQNMPAARANGGAEIDVLRVHEVALVEQARRLGLAATDEQARSAHPVDLLLAPCQAIDIRRDCRCPVASSNQQLLAQLRERRLRDENGRRAGYR